jgi:hypothetical protein
MLLTLVQRSYRRALAGVLLLAGCRSIVDPPLPANARAITPMAVYRTWWGMIESCSGITAAFDDVRWYVLPNSETVPYPGRSDVNAYWSLAHDQIVIAGLWALDGALVRHEMLHALTRSGHHSRAEFLGKCGGIVECNDACIADTEPPSPFAPGTPTIGPDQLQVSIEVTPSSPSIQTDGGFFTVTVSATNTTDHPAIVALADSNASNLGTTFVLAIQGPAGGESEDVRPHDPGAVRFAAHETKRRVFDFRVGDDTSSYPPQNFPPGEYSIGGQFGVRQRWLYQTATLRP